MAGPDDVDRAVWPPRAPLSKGPGGGPPPNERSRLLHALADAIEANRKELAELETRNVGKAISSVKGEVKSAAENFRFYASALGSIAGSTRPIGGSILTYTLKEPVGVCAPDRPLELPDHARRLEALAGAGRGLHGRAEARPRRRRSPRCASPSSPPRPASRRASSTSCPATGRRRARTWSPTPAWTRSRSPARPTTGSRDHAPRRGGDREARVARARRQEPEHRLRRRRPRRRGRRPPCTASTTRPARAATPARACSSRRGLRRRRRPLRGDGREDSRR